MSKGSNRYLVPGLLRGLEILRLFSRERQVLGAPDIALELGIPRTTVFRLLQTLEHAGYVVRAESGRDYRLGIGVLNLGFAYLASQELTELARPVLERLRDDTGCATHLCVRDGRDVVYLLRVPGRSVVSSSVGVGTRLPAHATSLGRVFLADLEAQELAELYAGATLTRHSAHTPGTLGELTRLLQADRERGFVISEGFYEKGINAIAGPVRDAGGRVVAVINLIARDGEADSAQLHGELLERVLAAAAQLSTALAYQPRAAAGARR